MTVKESKRRVVRLAIERIFQLHIPVAVFAIPTMSHGALGKHQPAVVCVYTDKFPIAFVQLGMTRQLIGAK